MSGFFHGQTRASDPKHGQAPPPDHVLGDTLVHQIFIELLSKRIFMI